MTRRKHGSPSVPAWHAMVYVTSWNREPHTVGVDKGQSCIWWEKTGRRSERRRMPSSCVWLQLAKGAKRAGGGLKFWNLRCISKKIKASHIGVGVGLGRNGVRTNGLLLVFSAFSSQAHRRHTWTVVAALHCFHVCQWSNGKGKSVRIQCRTCTYMGARRHCSNWSKLALLNTTQHNDAIGHHWISHHICATLGSNVQCIVYRRNLSSAMQGWWTPAEALRPIRTNWTKPRHEWCNQECAGTVAHYSRPSW